MKWTCDEEQKSTKRDKIEYDCGFHSGFVNADIIEHMENDEQFNALANLFKIFGDVTRIKILKVLRVQEMCVHDLSKYVNMSQSAVSHQLRVLKQARLVKGIRVGKSVFYSLDDDHVKKIIDMGIEHINHL